MVQLLSAAGYLYYLFQEDLEIPQMIGLWKYHSLDTYLLQFGEKEAKRQLYLFYNFLRRGNREESSGIFSLATIDMMYGNGTKLHQGRFKLDIRKK